MGRSTVVNILLCKFEVSKEWDHLCSSSMIMWKKVQSFQLACKETVNNLAHWLSDTAAEASNCNKM